MGYAIEYIELISKALKDIIVTDANSKEISFDYGLEIWAEQVEQKCKEQKGLTFFCGNGASATMAEHMSHDWFQNAKINTTTCAETSHITAISNDIGYEDVFSYRVERILSDKDIFVGISSSGNSPNIIKAIDMANEKGAFTISISGMSADNEIRKRGDLNFYVPLIHYGEVESAHAVLLHATLDYYLDRHIGGRH